MTAAGDDNVVPLHPMADAGEAGAPPPAGGEGGKTGRKRRKRELPPGFFDNYRTLVEKYVLIHGTDTAWDGVHKMVVKVAHLRLTYSSEAVKAWLNSPERRMVTKDCVVFDPTNSVDRRTHVNLFDRFELRPRKGKCTAVLNLLDHLVGGDARARDWILRWIALPLQRPGEKMATAIIMHGAEGTGKNIFWSAVRAIYGRYGTMIGQRQLEADFNGWLSAKLFVIGNEVLGRKEKWELKGALKHLVTEDEIYINEKNMPERVEHNHANLVFLSNEVQPLVLGKGDRRYLVVDCWQTHPDGDAYYEAVRAELRAGGIEAFYDVLLTLPLEGFNAHTKPPDTEAKRDLVELGKDEPDRFFDQWRAGLLDLPYGAAAADDLYAAFRRWCVQQGERHVPTLTRFGRSAKVIMQSGIKRLRLARRGVLDERQRTYYWDEGSVPDCCESVNDWLRDQAQAFREALSDQAKEGEV